MKKLKLCICLLLVSICFKSVIVSQVADSSIYDCKELTNREKEIIDSFILKTDQQYLLETSVFNSSQITKQMYLERNEIIKSLIDFLQQEKLYEMELQFQLRDIQFSCSRFEYDNFLSEEYVKILSIASGLIEVSIDLLESNNDVCDKPAFIEICNHVQKNKEDINTSISILNKCIRDYNNHAIILNKELHSIPLSTIKCIERFCSNHTIAENLYLDEVELLSEYKEYPESSSPMMSFE